MSQSNLIITPKTRVGELLDAYPDLENILFELSPAFSKLRNPLLRKTVARVASLQQAAAVGGLKVDELVNRLRKEAGQKVLEVDIGESGYIVTSPPAWFGESGIVVRFDATPVINSGGNPMNEIFAAFQSLQAGKIAELTTPFVPAPILDKFREKGFKVFSLQKGDKVISYLSRI